MQSVVTSSETQTREVDIHRLAQENIRAMLKPKVTLTRADSIALLNSYESLLNLAGQRMTDTTREQYSKALEQFRCWVATVPHIDERLATRLQNTEALLTDLRRDTETAFCVLIVMCSVTLVVCIGTLLSVLYLAVLQRRASMASLAVVVNATMPSPSAPRVVVTTDNPKHDPPLPPRYHLLGLSTPFAASCDPIYPHSQTEELGFDLDDLRYSLRYALLHGEQRISAVNAIHIGFPYCYTAINTNYSGGQPWYHHPSDDPVVEMFNLRLAGYTPENRSRVREKHIECDRSEWFVRFKSIWVQYEDATGRTVERRFDGPMAFELQHMIELNLGRFRCNERQREELSKEIHYALARATRDARPYEEKHLDWILPPPTFSTEGSSPPPKTAQVTPQLPDS